MLYFSMSIFTFSTQAASALRYSLLFLYQPAHNSEILSKFAYNKRKQHKSYFELAFLQQLTKT